MVHGVFDPQYQGYGEKFLVRSYLKKIIVVDVQAFTLLLVYSFFIETCLLQWKQALTVHLFTTC
jgi:hypothetical protein